MHFLPEELDDYVVRHSANEPEHLKRLTKETYQKILQPRMLSGPYQGRVLSMISKLLRPISILEIGTFTGYSALCLAEGLKKNGLLHTIDIKEEMVDFQRKHFDSSPYGEVIIQHLGMAIDIIPTINTTFDLVFIDADKSNYINYFNLIIDKMNPEGVILTDNVLWSGKVTKPLKDKDIDTAVLLDYNKMIHEDPRVETVILPIRDGLTISRVFKR
ncbi:O-methyltransferase [Dokdonia sp. Hel_I_53]|uniref:O-methyltransferase n=1 Tax=Dokdonia sp. Hel_I_53 TaxID=1566287 RepID=UPI00119C8C4A|nr:O-methyltransferase [Dokdonia sp. Hel_I_53]TVZ51964.1 putative O-methyltransferase YrrM [Dokdonia sp. Hel_I_53]